MTPRWSTKNPSSGLDAVPDDSYNIAMRLAGKDGGGRRLALIFTRRGDRLRPVSARPMRRKEREVYEEAIDDQGEEDQGT